MAEPLNNGLNRRRRAPAFIVSHASGPERGGHKLTFPRRCSTKRYGWRAAPYSAEERVAWARAVLTGAWTSAVQRQGRRPAEDGSGLRAAFWCSPSGLRGLRLWGGLAAHYGRICCLAKRVGRLCRKQRHGTRQFGKACVQLTQS